MIKNPSKAKFLLLAVLAILISCTTTHEVRDHRPATIRETEAALQPLLLETEWLANMTNSSKLRLIDYGRKKTEYQKGHIPGSGFMMDPGQSGEIATLHR